MIASLDANAAAATPGEGSPKPWASVATGIPAGEAGPGEAKAFEPKPFEPKPSEPKPSESKLEAGTQEAMATEPRASEPRASRPDIPDPVPPPARSNMPVILAAVVGGLVGGALVLAAGAMNLVPLGDKGGDDTLGPRLTAAEQDIASGKAALDQALAKVSASESAAKAAQDAANNALAMAGDAQKAASSAGAASEAPAAPSAPATVPDLSGITDRLAKAETDVAALNDAMRQVGAATSSLSQQIAALKAAAANTPDKAAAYAVALSQLAEAIQNGKPFTAELNTANALGDHGDALAPLSALADSGVPSIETLAASYDAVKPQIVASLTPKPVEPPADASVLDRLTSSLGGIVTATPEGTVPEGDPAWPAQKVSDALRRGDLAGAIAAFKAMPDAGQQAGAAWLHQASGAVTALELIKGQTSAALQKFTGQ